MSRLCLTFMGSWLALAGNAFATGQDRGNGGDVIVCRGGDNEIISMEMADLYEARTIRSIPTDMGPDSLSPVEKALFAANRLMRLDPTRAKYFQNAVAKFMDKVWLVDEDLEDVPDTGNIRLTKGCTMEQIAVRFKPETPNDRNYWINKRLWEHPKFDNNQKAALILHEVIFGKMIDQGHQNSRNARAIVSYVASPLLDQMTYTQYEKDLLIRLQGAVHFNSSEGKLVYYLPSRVDDYFSATRFCKTISPNTREFDGAGYFQHIRSLKADIQRDQTKIWGLPCFVSGDPTGLVEVAWIDELATPRKFCVDPSESNVVMCSCVGSSAGCQPYEEKKAVQP